MAGNRIRYTGIRGTRPSQRPPLLSESVTGAGHRAGKADALRPKVDELARRFLGGPKPPRSRTALARAIDRALMPLPGGSSHVEAITRILSLLAAEGAIKLPGKTGQGGRRTKKK